MSPRRRINPQEGVYIPEKDYELCLSCRNTFCHALKPEKCWNVFTKSMAADAYDMITSGRGIYAASRKIGVAPKRIIRLLNKSGYNMQYAKEYIRVKRKAMDDADTERAFNLYKKFRSFRRVGNEIGFGYRSVQLKLNKHQPFIDWIKNET